MTQTRYRFPTKKQCVICGNSFEATRKDARYCSGKCRQAAAYERKRVESRSKANLLDLFDMQDVRTISKYTAEGAATIVKVAAVAGKELAREVLDGYWAVLVACGQLDPK